MTRMRADLLLVARGLAESRAKARAAIEAGGVRANGAAVTKASELIDESAVLDVTAAHPWVSRGGVKLAAALDAFAVDPDGRVLQQAGDHAALLTELLDLDHVTRTREFGTLGLTQSLKQLRDSGRQFPIYQQGVAQGEGFKRLGPLAIHTHLRRP